MYVVLRLCASWAIGLGLAVIRHLLNDKLLPEASVMDREDTTPDDFSLIFSNTHHTSR